MQKSMFLASFLLLLGLFSCTKPQPTVVEQPHPLLGTWVRTDDTAIKCHILKIEGAFSMVAFDKRIADPHKEPIYIQYSFSVVNDTMQLRTEGIYPAMRFWYDGYRLHGQMVEYRNVEGQGSFKDIVKVQG